MREKRPCLVRKQGSFRLGVGCLFSGCLFAIFCPQVAIAGNGHEARVTQSVGAVTLVSADGTPRQPVLGEAIAGGGTVQTAANARAEVSFAGETIGRLGANTIFKFNDGSRKLQLGEGVVLLHAPKKGGRCEIQLGGVSAAVTNCTVVSELHTSLSAVSFKLLVLNGTARLYRPGHWGDSVLVRPGQMVIGNPAQPVSDPVDVDVSRFVKTCRLINDFGPVGSEKLLAKEGEKQARAKGKKALVDTNLVIFGEGSLVTLTNPDTAAPADDAAQNQAGPQPSRGPTVSLQSPRIDNKATAIAR